VIKFEIPIPPVPKARARITRFGAYTPGQTKAFENQVALHVKKLHSGPPFNTPMRVYIECHVKRPLKPQKHCRTYPAMRPDVDNFQKSIMDALNDVLWKDDALLCDVRCIKIYSTDKPRILIKLESMDDVDSDIK
jgi:Holliday junction resolvase RusA-like endonuclease